MFSSKFIAAGKYNKDTGKIYFNFPFPNLEDGKEYIIKVEDKTLYLYTKEQCCGNEEHTNKH